MGLLPILFVQIQLAQGILCVLVSSLSGLREILRRFGDVPLHDFAFEILLAQAVGGEVASVVGGVLQPLNRPLAKIRISDKIEV